ncbi:lysylphosphatidylglycerol synthase transmembrane domain-containing protein [Bacillus piscicola]|uniref:lysylphosphatidylglycerol synthase transmembrane domain-containing protein n=1 Tax=Bacillus piscicola TaxID=1632684 RepID=UPI001F08F5C5|nr:lysylphosphatidylglycerol synthase transmembrane domain-containing protein [Bacillus piscicola]
MLEQELKNRTYVKGSYQWKRWIPRVARLLVSAGASLFLILYIDWDNFFTYLAEANLIYAGGAFLVVHLCIWISGWKWYILCRDEQGIGFFQYLKWYYIGFFFNNFLPGSLGGDGARIYYASKQIGAPKAAASVAVERVFAGIAMFVVMTVGLLSVNRSGSFLVEIGLVFALCLLAYNLLFNYRFTLFMKKRFGKKVQSFYDVLANYKRARLLLELICFSLAFQLAFVWVTDLLYRSLGVSIPFFVQLGFVSLISALTMIPVSINGIGIREGTYAYLFTLVGVDESVSVAVSLLFFGLVLAATSVGGILYLLERGERSHEEKVTT